GPIEFDPFRLFPAFTTPGVWLARWIQFRRMAVSADIHHRIHSRIEGVARQSLIGQRGHVEGVLLVRHQKAVAPVVKSLAEAACARRNRLQPRAVRLETKTGVAEVNLARKMWSLDDAAAGSSRGDVNPVINAPARVADPCPDLANAEAGEQLFLHFRF